MTSSFNKKNLLLAAAISGLTFGSSAWADYDIQNLGERNSYDLEAGVVAKSVYSEDGSDLVLINNGVETVIASNEYSISDVGLSNGSVYWTESNSVGGVWMRDLFKYENGTEIQVTENARSKEGFAYDGQGNAAWIEDEGEAPNVIRNVYYYNGSEVVQITDNNAGFGINAQSINVSGNTVVWLENSTIKMWDGNEVTQISPAGQLNVQFPNFDGNSVAWLAKDDISGRYEVFQYEDGVVAQLTDDGAGQFGIKQSLRLEDGIISYEVNVNPYVGSVSDHLYIIQDGEHIKLSERAVASDIDGGKVIWTEGDAADTPDSLFEYVNGETTEIDTAPLRIVGIEADGGYVMWTELVGSGGSTNLVLASPVAGPSINLGGENNITDLAVNGEQDVEISQWSGWGWNPTYVELGVTSLDGQSLDGVTVVGKDGVEHALSGEWGRIPQTFDWNAQSMTIKASGRNVQVHWWATTEPNPSNLGAEHSGTVLDLNKAHTIEVSQWSNWGWNPNNIGFGFSAQDGMALDGIVVIDSDGNSHSLNGEWTSVNRPFYWQPVKLVIPAQPGRSIKVEWWAAG